MKNNNLIKPTTEWLQANYYKLNKELFNGKLGLCKLQPFTKGKGANGNTLGWFKITSKHIRVEHKSRKMFYDDGYYGRKYINNKNFVELCEPCIELNANYSWTEDDMLATLAHEMCHYYTYMNGIAPKQGHGPEFYTIGRVISENSNGKFTIQRLASAEQMSRMKLDSAIEAKNKQRVENKKAKMKVIFVFTTTNKIEMTLTSSQSVIDDITILAPKKTRYNVQERGYATKILLSNDLNLINFLYDNGYRKNMRTYRFWNIENKPWVDTITNYDYKVLYGDKDTETNIKPIETVEKPQEKKQTRMFRLKLTNGNTFETQGEQFLKLFKELQNRFPNMKKETIEKLISNPKNYYYKMNENKSAQTIIEQVINNFLKEEFNEDNDTISIDPEMNLGLESPLEMDF